MKKMLTIGLLVGSLFITGCQSTQETDNYNELYGYANSEGYYKCVHCDNYSVDLDRDNPYMSLAVPSEANGVYEVHLANAGILASQVWEATKCHECSLATYRIASEHPDFDQTVGTLESYNDAIEHVEKCSYKHDEVNYKPNSEAQFVCINCGKLHYESESYYNEDGTSVCSAKCFNEVAN